MQQPLLFYVKLYFIPAVLKNPIMSIFIYANIELLCNAQLWRVLKWTPKV